mmetsp:Transcript_23976/g.47861  ORF Transcript_23976/g.47861 Transcript_23976/m.47861 type:complete len:82 (-) Transcript_23976:3-248(-)
MHKTTKKARHSPVFRQDEIMVQILDDGSMQQLAIRLDQAALHGVDTEGCSVKHREERAGSSRQGQQGKEVLWFYLVEDVPG